MMIKSQKSDFICPFLPGKRDIPIVLKANEFYENCQEQFLLTGNSSSPHATPFQMRASGEHMPAPTQERKTAAVDHFPGVSGNSAGAPFPIPLKPYPGLMLFRGLL